MCAREAQMKRTPELASRVRPELAETLLEANSSDKLIKVAQWLFASPKLYRAFKTLCISFETYSNRLDTWPIHHESISQGDRRADRCNVRIAADDRNQRRLGLPRRIR